jgi:hypothetical protein
VVLDFVASSARRARAFLWEGGGWKSAASCGCETCLGAGAPREYGEGRDFFDWVWVRAVERALVVATEFVAS